MKQAAADKRSARLAARITPSLRDLLKRAAAIQGQSVSDFVVGAVKDAAARAIDDTQAIRLSPDAQKAIYKAIVDPPEPTGALRKAISSSRELAKARA